MTRVVDVDRVGSIDLLDLKILSERYGRDFLPYPFMQTRRDPFVNYDEYSAYATEVPDRYLHGDLKRFQRWISTYLQADLRVECSVQSLDSDTAGLRMVAHRAGEFGFLATQQADDTVMVSALNAYDIGTAIAATVELTKPGKRPEIVIPDYAPRPPRKADDGSISVRERIVSHTAVTTPRSDVEVFARVQSHWQPARDWGFDGRKHAVVWVRIRDDGEYIYAPDLTCAKPMTARLLSERIDRLIAQDVTILRELRDG
jgi:EspG family